MASLLWQEKPFPQQGMRGNITRKFKYLLPLFGLVLGSANYAAWAKSSPMPVFISKVLLEHSHVICFQSVAVFTFQWQRWVALTETIWSVKPKVQFGSFQKTFALPWSRGADQWRIRHSLSSPPFTSLPLHPCSRANTCVENGWYFTWHVSHTGSSPDPYPKL